MKIGIFLSYVGLGSNLLHLTYCHQIAKKYGPVSVITLCKNLEQVIGDDPLIKEVIYIEKYYKKFSDIFKLSKKYSDHFSLNHYENENLLLDFYVLQPSLNNTNSNSMIYTTSSIQVVEPIYINEPAVICPN